MTRKEFFIKKMNELAKNKEPFVFLIDFEILKPVIYTLEKAAKNQFYYDINGKTNFRYARCIKKVDVPKVKHISLPNYINAFKKIMQHIKLGDTYLLNLTCRTSISTQQTLSEIFEAAKAPFKLLYKDEFVLFSPEKFIRIEGNNIFSYPMKGTIDASIPNAEQLILDDKKELFEHNTIVDLIRNDLSIIADNVRVHRFRYIEKIKSKTGSILQVSSEIKGKMPDNWQHNIANMLFKLLPAGSISGAPKQKTVEILQEVENRKRGYYTGIFGIFDGNNLDTAVNIRFIENHNGTKYYHSGGGITALSKYKEEYHELNQKIYIPTY